MLYYDDSIIISLTTIICMFEISHLPDYISLGYIQGNNVSQKNSLILKLSKLSSVSKAHIDSTILREWTYSHKSS